MNNNQENNRDDSPSLLKRIRSFFRNTLFLRPRNLEDVSEVLENSLSSDIIDDFAFSIAEKAIHLRSITIKEIMVPRVEMVTLDINSDPQELLDQVIQSGHSRYPVLNLEKKSVEGLLLAKDFLPILRKEKQIEIKDLLREAKVVPETKKADSLLDDFKRDKSHLAVVIDEYGEICGLVTIEDILEELVGEIEDEHDIDDNDLVQVSETEYIADARIEIDEFERKFGLDLNESGVETLGGLITKKLDALPKVGNIVHIGEIELVVTAADKRKIKKIGINLKN